MSGLLKKYLSDYLLYHENNDLCKRSRQGEMLVSSLLLGVERAVKTYAEFLLPFRRPPTFGLPILPRSHQKVNFPELEFSDIPDVEIWFDQKW